MISGGTLGKVNKHEEKSSTINDEYTIEFDSIIESKDKTKSRINAKSRT